MGMGYEVTVERKAQRTLARIERRHRERIEEKIDALADDPRPQGCVSLKGEPGYRIRVGDYRIIYTVDDQVRIVTVTRVRGRGDVYRRR